MTYQQQMIWLTILLVVFGAAQAAFTWWGGHIQRRAAEAEADRRLEERIAADLHGRRKEDRDWDVARRLATTETMRLGLLITRFNSAETPDLLVSVGLFDPCDFKVASPADFARNMALVGPEAGDLASMVITMCDDFATRLHGLVRILQTAAPSAGVAKLRELNSASPLTQPILIELRRVGDELKGLIDDASQQCLPADLGKRRFQGTPKSALAKAYKASWERDGKRPEVKA
jgi:hypothetical protein